MRSAPRWARARRPARLAGVHPVDLLAHPLRALVERTGARSRADRRRHRRLRHPGRRAEPQHRPPRRCSRPATPSGCPATTIDRQCGSSQQAIHFAAQGILAGRLRRGRRRRRRVDEPGPDGSSAVGATDLDGVAFRRPLPRGPRAPGHRGRAHRRASGASAATSSTSSRCAPSSGPRRPATPGASTTRSRRSRCPAPTARSSRSTTDEGIRAVDRSRAWPRCAPPSGDDGLRRALPPDRRGPPRPATRRSSPTARPPCCSPAPTAPPSSACRRGPASTRMVVEGDDPLYMLTAVIPATRKLLGPAGPVDRRHRPVRGQRGVRLGGPGVGRRSSAPTSTGSTSTAAPSPSATRSAHPAPASPPRCSTPSSSATPASASRSCARPAAWPTR